MPENDAIKALFAGGSLDYESFISAAAESGIEPGDIRPLREKYESRFRAMKTEAALTEELAKTPALDRGIIEKLIDGSSVEITEDGDVRGLTEQLDSLRRSYPFLFQFAGVKGVPTGCSHGSLTDPDSMTDDEYYRSIGL